MCYRFIVVVLLHTEDSILKSDCLDVNIVESNLYHDVYLESFGSDPRILKRRIVY